VIARVHLAVTNLLTLNPWHVAISKSPLISSLPPFAANYPEFDVTVADVENRSVILVVEDEESYTGRLNIGLTVEGFVVVGHQHRQARQLMVSAKPDLVLLDIMLPDGSASTTARALHSTRTPSSW